jgi:hypothetical protein
MHILLPQTDVCVIWQVYATSFFAIPFFRWILLLRTNSEITKRNEARFERAQALEFPNPSLRRKVFFLSLSPL